MFYFILYCFDFSVNIYFSLYEMIFVQQCYDNFWTIISYSHYVLTLFIFFFQLLLADMKRKNKVVIKVIDKDYTNVITDLQIYIYLKIYLLK